jgi:hypothetical protein
MEEVGEKRWEEDRGDDRKRKSEIECKGKFVCKRKRRAK